jgi:Flp pilus assembly protein CpaB
MARIRVFIVLALAVAAGGTFAYGTYQYIQNVPKGTTPSSSLPTSAVIVAAQDLQIGAALRQEDLRAIQWPSNAVPAGAFGKPEDLIGRGLIQPVMTNEVFLPSKLASKEAGAGLPPVIPEGFRALSVRVNDVIGVAGYVLPGTKVDVVATVNPTQFQPDITSKVILTNVLVLAAGTKNRAGREEQADSGECRHAARQPGRSGEARVGEHGGQDSARPSQSSRQDGADDLRHQAGRADGHRSSSPQSRHSVGTQAAAGRPSARAGPHGRNHPR